MRIWTDEQRKRQSELIRARKPWLRSTGPRTQEGKRHSSQNAYKHGFRARAIRDLYKTMSEFARLRRAALAKASLLLQLLREQARKIKNPDKRTVMNVLSENTLPPGEGRVRGLPSAASRIHFLLYNEGAGAPAFLSPHPSLSLWERV